MERRVECSPTALRSTAVRDIPTASGLESLFEPWRRTKGTILNVSDRGLIHSPGSRDYGEAEEIMGLARNGSGRRGRGRNHQGVSAAAMLVAQTSERHTVIPPCGSPWPSVATADP
jgi:hypothetical protein